MRKKMMMFLSCLLIGVGVATAQTQKVAGTVTSDDDGLPIIGASVMVQGTSMGTITDVDGNFSIINIPASAKNIEVSYIGMKSVVLPIKPVMNITLYSDTKVLDEVMVVAFGKAKKSAFTGSAAVVSSDQIISRQTSNISNALTGQVAGVQTTSSSGQPGEAAKVRIRGIGSIAASNNPLYVVDGVPFDGSLSSLNTQDIEGMTVLKDAASNALYGARGANGVILITTKKGKIGKPVINVDAKWGNNRKAIPNYDVINSPGRYYELMYGSYYNSVVADRGHGEAHKYANSMFAKPTDGGLGYQVYTLPDGQSLVNENGRLNPEATLGYAQGGNYFMPDNWFDEVFNTSNLRQEYNVNVSGANERMNYYMSAGYLGDEGIIPNSEFDRFSSRIKADYQVYDWLKVGANVSYVRSKSSFPRNQSGSSSGNLFYVANMMAPIYPLYVRDESGAIMKDGYGYTVYDFGDAKHTDFKRPFMSQSNPASSIELDKRRYETDFFSGQWFANFSILPDLMFSVNLGTDVSNRRTASRLNPFYGQYEDTGGILSAASRRTATMNKQFLLTYNFEVGKHGLDFLVGYEAFSLKINELSGSKEKIYNVNVIDLNNAINNPSVSSYTDKYNTAGYLGRVQYDYDGKYFGSMSFRRDGSSRFHKDNRWGNFWSIGGGWLMSEEDFLSDVKWVDMLKFKMSYGVQGNDDLLYSDGVTSNYYPYADQYILSKQGAGFGLAFDYKGNKDITWETSHSFNTGFDYAFFGNRLTGSFEYFSRKTTDMLYYKPTAPSLGYSTMPMNVGSMINRGVELDINGVLYENRNIEWAANVNLTHVRNKIKKLDKSLNGQLIDGTRIYREGESLYQLYLRKYAGVNDEGVALYYMEQENEETGAMETVTTTTWGNATQYGTGDILPKVYGGFGTSLKLFDFDLSVSFAYQMGGRLYDNTYAGLMHNGSRAGQNFHKDAQNAWTPDNSNSSVPRMNRLDQFSNSLSDRFLISSNYLSLQNITVGYNLPKNLLNPLGVTNLRLYLVADNVALMSKRKGLDPRQGYSSSGSDVYSPMRTISGGVNISF